MKRFPLITISTFALIWLAFSSLVTGYDPALYEAQQALKKFGYDPGPIDGQMGKRTRDAIREFQQDKGIPVTGKLDKATRDELLGDESLSLAYISQKYKYSIVYDSNWSKGDLTIEPNIDLILICSGYTCQSHLSNITFGAGYNHQLKDIKNDLSEKILHHIDGRIITTNVRNQKDIKNFKIIKEGITRIEGIFAYEVVMKYESFGKERIRHTYMIFNNGFIYNISFHSFFNSYKNDFEIAYNIVSTFKFKD